MTVRLIDLVHENSLNLPQSFGMQKIPVGGALVYRMSRVVMNPSRRPESPLRYSVVPGADMAVTSPPEMPETPTSPRRESRPCHAAVVAVFEITSSMFVQPLRLRPVLRRLQSRCSLSQKRQEYVPPASPYPEAIVAV